MSGLDYCFTQLPDWVQQLCSNFRKGGISAYAIIQSDAGITSYDNYTQWTTAIASEKVKIIKGIKGEWPDGSPIEGENPSGCGNDTVLDGFDHVINIMDFNVNANNDSAYADVNGRQVYIALYNCNEQELIVIEEAVTVVAMPANVPMTKKEKMRYNVQLKFSTDADFFPIRVSAPASLFE